MVSIECSRILATVLWMDQSRALACHVHRFKAFSDSAIDENSENGIRNEIELVCNMKQKR